MKNQHHSINAACRDGAVVGALLMAACFIAATLPALAEYLKSTGPAYERLREAGASPGAWFVIKLLIVHLLVGAGLGFLGGGAASLLAPGRWAWTALFSLGFVALAVLLAAARLAVRQPHFYDPFLTGWTREILYLLTDKLTSSNYRAGGVDGASYPGAGDGLVEPHGSGKVGHTY